ncbi:flagellar motor protein MotB [Paenibacillus xerothermodurans]|uniref:Flagellar motor protein n=1 Tax=Paenibacillus xerothermodurans TaxID=1977292 RepID=A0A2W1N623_PAEXE|nr:flagellar motor protein MotB [Paenibacillus xerothermodurans]PZE19264.1 flagellar motor protein [Paenibacillus xerothermodurans]
MARRGRKREEHVNHERWLITYADLITLLLIFFVIMYAMSKIDSAKYELLSQSLNMEFKQADSMLPNGEGILEQLSVANVNDGDKTQDGEQDKNAEADREQQLQDLLAQIQQYIQQNNLQAQVHATDTPRGIAVTLNDLFLFDIGKAELKQDAYPILNQLGTLFPTLNTTISIEGHTDNVPLSTGSIYRDNWGLSNERSLSVLRYFINDLGHDPKSFISTGYAETRPIKDNSTAENRAENRRVEIVVLRSPHL